MTKVTVYKFKKYDITHDEYLESRRWATLDAVERAHGVALMDTATKIDASAVDADHAGMTEVGFNPHPRVGFQRAE